jgi:hypothetical protein
MQAASAGLGAVGSIIQGIGGLRAGQFNAAVDKQNAKQAQREGAAEAERIQGQARAAMGEQVGAQAESGFQTGTGSAIDALRASGINSELDVLNTRRKAQAQANAELQKAQMARMQGQMALVGGLTGAAGAVARSVAPGGAGGGGGGVDYSQLYTGSIYNTPGP